MPTVTVVRSMIGLPIRLPDHKEVIRPFHYVELGRLTKAQCEELTMLQHIGHVQLGQLLDGAPLSRVRLVPTETDNAS